MKLTKKVEEKYIKEGKLIPLFRRQYCPKAFRNKILSEQIEQGIIGC